MSNCVFWEFEEFIAKMILVPLLLQFMGAIMIFEMSLQEWVFSAPFISTLAILLPCHIWLDDPRFLSEAIKLIP